MTGTQLAALCAIAAGAVALGVCTVLDRLPPHATPSAVCDTDSHCEGIWFADEPGIPPGVRPLPVPP